MSGYLLVFSKFNAFLAGAMDYVWVSMGKSTFWILQAF